MSSINILVGGTFDNSTGLEEVEAICQDPIKSSPRRWIDIEKRWINNERRCINIERRWINIEILRGGGKILRGGG